MKATLTVLKRCMLKAMVILLFTSFAYAKESTSTPVFNDIEKHWASDAIEEWAELGVLKGYEDGSFRPNGTITRAELIAVLDRMSTYPDKQGRVYKDVKKGDWYYDIIERSGAYNIVQTDGLYVHPNEAISREEAIYTIARAFKIESLKNYLSNEETDYTRLTDRESISEKYNGRLIRAMVNNQFVHGYPDGGLHPKATITRAELITILDNIIDVFIDKPGVYTLEPGETPLVNSTGVTLKFTRTDKTQSSRGTVIVSPLGASDVLVIDSPLYYDVHIFAVFSGEYFSSCFSCTGSATAGFHAESITDEYQTYCIDTRFNAGAGTEDDPYLIERAEQLRYVGEKTEKFSNQKYYKLAQDILLPQDWDAICGFDESQNDLDRVPYATIDGDGHHITWNTTHTLDDKLYGIFGVGEIDFRNIVFDGNLTVNIPDDFDGLFSIGGVIASCPLGGVFYCENNIELTVNNYGHGNGYIGGYIGCLQGISGAEHSNFDGSVTVTSSDRRNISVGGIIGVIPGDSGIVGVNYCTSGGVVQANGGESIHVGGVIGAILFSNYESLSTGNYHSIVSYCASDAVLSAANASFQQDIGGIVGQVNLGNLKNCSAAPTITSDGSGSYGNMGGIVGACYKPSKIAECESDVSKMDISKANHYGGITGRNEGDIQDCVVKNAKTSGFKAENTFVFESWNTGTVSGCTCND